MKNLKPHILVVDDEAGIRETLYYNLTDRGFHVETAANSKEALQRLRDKKFNVVLSDIIMDNGDGISLLQKLKQLSQHLPVIFFTGYASMDTLIKALNPNFMISSLLTLNSAENWL